MRFRVLEFIVILMLAVACCDCSHAVAPTTLQQLRADRTRRRAYEIDEQLGEAYDAYRNTDKAQRGKEFASLAMTITFILPFVPATDCLEFLGRPDLSKENKEEVSFLYFFDNSSGVRNFIDVTVPRDGNTVTFIGWNRVGTLDFRAKGYK